MLSASDLKFIRSIKEKKETLSNSEKQKYYRIRKKVQKAIADLIFVAENLPEKQLNQVFDDNTIISFMIAVLHEAPEEGNKRICMITMRLIGSVLGNSEFAERIVPEEAKWMIKRSEDPSKVVESLFFASMCKR